jgi:hypothetical protein
MMPGGGGDVVQQQVQLAAERGERAARQRGRRGVEFQVELVQLDGDPRIGRLGTDGLVAWQRPTRAVDQEQLQLGTDRGRAGPETGTFQQLPQRAQALREPFGEAQVITLIEQFLIYLGSHRRTSPPWTACSPWLWFAAAV